MQRAPSALDLTLDPVGLEEFLEAYCDRRPLVLERAEPGRFDAVLSDADVERLVCETALRSPAFRLVRDGAQLPLSGYAKDIPWRPGGFSGTALVDRVADEHAAGATLVLQALHLHHHPAALYCRGLEIALGWPVQANAYCTPAGAQGFAVHHDTHDVFVLQVSGHKHWRIYEPVLALPCKDQRWRPELADDVGQPLHDITLRAGDTLYLPRGWPHEAAAADAGSLHVTVGLHPPTRLDAMRAALAACADDVEFRRALGADGELPAELVERLAGRLGADDVARRARRRFVDSRRPILDGQLTQVRGLDALTVDTPLQRRHRDRRPRAAPRRRGRAALRGQGGRPPAARRRRRRRDPCGARPVHRRGAARPARRRRPARPGQAPRAGGLSAVARCERGDGSALSRADFAPAAARAQVRRAAVRLT